MATIPRYDQTTVELGSLPGPRMSGASPVGQATQGLGQTVQHLGGEVIKFASDEQRKANEMIVLDASVNFGKSWLEIDNVARQRVGKDALDIQGPMDMYEQEYNRALDGLKDEEQKRLFKLHNDKSKQQFTLNLERHASEQYGIMNRNNSKSKVDIESQKLSTLYRDPSQFDIRNPDSQINKLRASVADMLHIHGVSEGTPAWTEGMQAAEGKIYADRVKLLMNENPAEAQHFFEVHQDDIPVHEREQLKHQITAIGDEKEGTDAAFEMLAHVQTGDKTETEMEKMLHDKFSNRPKAFKFAKAQLSDFIRKDHDDKINSVSDVGQKIETDIDEAYASGRVLSSAEIRNMPEYQQLTKMGHKEANAELNKIRSYMAKVKHEAMAEHRQADGESNKRREEKQTRDQFKNEISDPETLTGMTETELIEKGRSAGLTYSELGKARKDRKALLKDSKALGHSKDNHDFVAGIITKSGVTDPSEVNKLITSANRFREREEERLGRKLSPKENEEAIIKGLQWEAVNTTQASFAGINYGKRGEVKRRADIKNEASILPGFDEIVSRLEQKRGRTFSDSQRKRLAEELLKEANK